MNCTDCKHRRAIPGDAHSQCVAQPFPDFVAMRSGRTAMPVIVNEHGYRNGWAFWPVNFDPVWIESCKLFAQRDATQGATP